MIIITTYVVKKERRGGNSPLVMSKAKRKGQWGGKVAPCRVENKKNTATRQLPPRRIKNKKNRATRRPLPPRCVENKKEHGEGATAPSLRRKRRQSNKKSVPYWTRFSYWVAGEGTQHEKRARLDMFFVWEGCRMAKLCCRRNEWFPPLGVETEPGGERGRTTGKNERGRSCLHVEADFPWCQNASKLSRHESRWG